MVENRKTLGDLGDMFSEGLKLQARRPNMVNYEPHPKQEAFHRSTDKIKLYIGGNRAGKTTGGAVEVLWWATDTHPYRETPPPPVAIRAIGSDFASGVDKIIIPEIARWVRNSDLRGGTWSKAYSAQKRTLHFANGSFIEFMSAESDLDKFAGTSRDLIWMDEEPSKDVYTENKARLIDKGGTVIFTMTPLLGLTWIYDDIYLKKNTDGITVIEVSMDENPYLNPAEVANFILGLSKDEKKSRVKGEFLAIGGLIFKDFKPEIHVIPMEVPPLDWEHYCSLDHGFKNPTAVLWHAVSPEGKIITYAEHYKSEFTVQQHAAAIHTKESLLGRVPDHRVADPALKQRNGITGTNIIQAYGELGLNFAPGTNDVNSSISIINQALKLSGGVPTWQITENCVNLIREMGRYKWDTHQSSKTAGRRNDHDVPQKKDDHAVDALRYFFTFLPDLKPFDPAVAERRATLGGDGNTYDQLLFEQAQNRLNPVYDENADDIAWSKEFG